MGQTLTHGIYLPDEGERNCYNGLAANWSILDGAVGTIAEHTAALAGKAPLVHTHTKADITDFPAYGNAAGTICEGNDSRLSDARTPVAHTHGKSDITDLFNSANTWSAKNTFSTDCIIYNSDDSGSVAGLKLRNSKAEILSTGNTSSDQAMTFRDKNDVAISYIRGAVQSNGVALKIGAYAKDSSNNTVNTELQLLAYSNGNKAIFPSTTNAYDLGSSSYQWNNLYAKNYFYNGVAWGLDKGNEWTQNQTIRNNSAGCILKNPTITKGVIPANNRNITFAAQDTNGDEIGRLLTRVSPNGETITWLSAHNLYKNGALDPTGNDTWANFVCYLSSDGSAHVKTNCDVSPDSYTTSANLGTSTNKWKSFNGINPGALSLPDNSGYTNISGNITDLTGSVNSYTPPFDGYVMVNVNPNSNNYAYVSLERVTVRSSSETTSGKNAMATIPVIGGKSIDISVIGASIAQARFTPCLGNV